MDEAVNALFWKGAATAAAVCWGTAQAQALADPTRPPATLMSVRGALAPVASAPSAPRLQSILIARHAGGRQVAVIDGQTVQVGEHFRGARIERMTETEVVLVKGAQRQVLKLFPAAASPGGQQQ